MHQATELIKHRKMTEYEIKMLNSALPYLPSFGEFDLFKKVSISTPVKDFEIGSVTGTEKVNILFFLIENGFAVARKDLNESGTTIQLTDEGRKLKNIGSYQKYQISLADISRDAKFQSQVMRYSFAVNCLIAFATLVAAVYYGIEIWKTCYAK